MGWDVLLHVGDESTRRAIVDAVAHVHEARREEAPAVHVRGQHALRGLGGLGAGFVAGEGFMLRGAVRLEGCGVRGGGVLRELVHVD